MADVLTAEQRHRNMAAIRSCDTQPEIVLRKALWHKGFRYRKNCRDMLGRPDIVLSKYRVAIFVHGCFWHRHEGCKYTTMPEKNRSAWEKKFAENVERDRLVVKKLTEVGWKVVVVWECEIKQDLNSVIRHIICTTGGQR